MTEYAAIADVGDTLVTVLRDRMGDLITKDTEVALASPGDVSRGDDVRLSIFLYRVEENGHLKDAERGGSDPDTVRVSPLVLDLRYLLTAHPTKGGGDPTANTREQHRVLGRAMQVLHDDPVLEGSELEGSLAGGRGFRMSLESTSTDEIVTLWNTFAETPYQPSVSYLATPVPIESTREREAQRVRERTIDSRFVNRGQHE